MKIHETTRADGTLEAVELRVGADGAMVLATDDGEAPLPEGALDAVMRKFGAPLESNEQLGDVAAIELGGGATLRHVRHLARYDVIARDWLVYESPGAEPLCAMATTVAGALEHLARALQVDVTPR